MLFSMYYLWHSLDHVAIHYCYTHNVIYIIMGYLFTHLILGVYKPLIVPPVYTSKYSTIVSRSVIY